MRPSDGLQGLHRIIDNVAILWPMEQWLALPVHGARAVIAVSLKSDPALHPVHAHRHETKPLTKMPPVSDLGSPSIGFICEAMMRMAFRGLQTQTGQ